MVLDCSVLFQQIAQFRELEKLVFVHRMPVIRDFPVVSSVTQGIAADAESLGCVGDPQLFIQFGHCRHWVDYEQVVTAGYCNRTKLG